MAGELTSWAGHPNLQGIPASNVEVESLNFKLEAVSYAARCCSTITECHSGTTT